MKRLFFWSLLLSLFLGRVAFGQFATTYYYDGGGAYTGTWHTSIGSIKFVYPAGLPDGTYYFYQAAGNNWSYRTISGGVAQEHVLGVFNYLGYETLSSPVYVASSNATWQAQYGGQLLGSITHTRTNLTGSTLGDNATTDLGIARTFTMPGGVGATPPMTAKLPVVLATNGKKAHTILVKHNGVTVRTFTSGVGSHSWAAAEEITLPGCVVGDVVTVTLDGKVVDTYTAGSARWPVPAESDGLAHNIPTYYLSVNDTAPPPAQTPTGTQTNGGTTQVNQGGEITTTVNNGDTTISGGSTGATLQDLYETQKQAFGDAMAERDARAPSVPAEINPGEVPDGTQLNTDAQSVKDGVSSIASGVVSKANGIVSMQAQMSALMASVRSGTRVPYVAAGNWDLRIPVTIRGETQQVDLTPYRTLFTWIRTVLSMIVVASFFVITQRLTRQAFAS